MIFLKIEWLGRPLVRLTSSGLAPDHHTPRLVPYGAQVAALEWFWDQPVTQIGFRLKSRAIPVITVREAYRGTAHIGAFAPSRGREAGV